MKQDAQQKHYVSCDVGCTIEHEPDPLNVCVRCNCEHANHFATEDLFGTDDVPSPKDLKGHEYGTVQDDAAPANVDFQYGDNFCGWCLTNCHPGTRHLNAAELKGLTR